MAEERRKRRKALAWSLGIFAILLVPMSVTFALADRGRSAPADGIPTKIFLDQAAFADPAPAAPRDASRAEPAFLGTTAEALSSRGG